MCQVLPCDAWGCQQGSTTDKADTKPLALTQSSPINPWATCAQAPWTTQTRGVRAKSVPLRDARCRPQESTADKADKGLLALMNHTATELARLTGPPPGPPKNTTLVQFRDPVLFYNSTAQLTQTLDVAQNLTERAKVLHCVLVARPACDGKALTASGLVHPAAMSWCARR